VRRRTAAIAFGGFVILGLPTGMLGVAWPSIRGDLDAPLAGLGVVLAAMTVTEFGSSALSGVVRDRFGTVALLLLPTALASGGLLLFSVAQTWSMVIAGAAVLGAGLGLLDAAVNTEAALRRGVRFIQQRATLLLVARPRAPSS
jgi:MFS family permease